MKRRLLPGALLFLVLQSGAAAAPPSTMGKPNTDTVPLAEYRKVITQAAAAFEMGKGRTAADISRQLRRIGHVRLPDNRVVDVDTGPVADALQRRAASPNKPDENNTARFDALRSLIVPASPANKGLREDPQKAAAVVLARSEFQYTSEAKQTDAWWARFGKAIGKWMNDRLVAFARWLDRLFGTPNRSVQPKTGMDGLAIFVKYLLIGLAIVAAVIGLVYLGFRYGKNGGWGRRRAKPGSNAGSEGGILDATEAELLDPLASAHLLAGSGDYRGAVRLVYIASLRRLAERGVLTLHPNRTNWEYQRALRSRSRPAYELLLPATHLFDRVWYGRQAATRAEYESVVALHDGLTAVIQPAVPEVTAVTADPATTSAETDTAAP